MSERTSPLARGLLVVGLLQVGVFALVWMGIGFGTFAMVTAGKWDLESDLERIAAGGVPTEALAVEGIERQEGSPARWELVAETPAGEPVAGLLTRDAAVAAKIEAEGRVEAYRVEGRWRVPELGDPRWGGRWIGFAFGCLPLVLGLLGWLLWRASKRWNAEAKARVDATTARVQTGGLAP